MEDNRLVRILGVVYVSLPLASAPEGLKASGDRIGNGIELLNFFGPNYYLCIRANKEYSPGYQHFWGEAYISTERDGSNKVQAKSISLRADGLPGVVDQQSCSNCLQVSAEGKLAGVVGGDFTSHWHASADVEVTATATNLIGAGSISHVEHLTADFSL